MDSGAVLCGRIGASWGLLEVSGGRLLGVLRRLGDVLERLGGVLEASWGRSGRLRVAWGR